jgi:hypothetical protein
MAALGSNLKPRGKDKWFCKCPIHKDKDWAMKIKQKPDMSLNITCYGCGANGQDLYGFLGIDMSELFGNRADSRDPDPMFFIRKNHLDDRMIIQLYKNMYGSMDCDKVPLSEKNKYKFAKMRKAGAERKYPELLSK